MRHVYYLSMRECLSLTLRFLATGESASAILNYHIYLAIQLGPSGSSTELVPALSHRSLWRLVLLCTRP